MSDELVPDPEARRRRLTPLAITLIAVGAALVLALAGTTIVFALAPRPAAQAEIVPSTTPTPSPSAVAAPEPIDRPGSRFELTCDELLSEAVVVSAIGTSVAPVANDPVQSLDDAAELQRGVMTCAWGSLGLTEPSVRVVLLPDAPDEFERVSLDEPLDDPEPADAYGDASRHGCVTYSGSARCSADILVGGSWVGIGVSGPGVGADWLPGLELLASHVVDAVGGASVVASAWTPPGSAFSGDFMWNEVAGLVADAFALPDAQAQGYDGVGPLDIVVWDASDYSMVPFGGTSEEYVTIATLPGGVWAAAELANREGASPAVVDGAEHASVLTIHDRQNVCFAIRGAAMCVTSTATSGDELVAQVNTFVASLPTV